MSTVTSFKDLTVWQKSFALTSFVYKIAKDLPPEERFSLANQMQRSAVSIPSNIAEGHQRGSALEYRHFLLIARGSAAELETQLLLTKELHSIKATDPALQLLEEVQKMLTVLIKKLDPKTYNL